MSIFSNKQKDKKIERLKEIIRKQDEIIKIQDEAIKNASEKIEQYKKEIVIYGIAEAFNILAEENNKRK